LGLNDLPSENDSDDGEDISAACLLHSDPDDCEFAEDCYEVITLVENEIITEEEQDECAEILEEFRGWNWVVKLVRMTQGLTEDGGTLSKESL